MPANSFAVEEDLVIGDEYVIEDNQGFGAAEFRVARIHGSPFQFPRIAGLAADNHENAFGIGRTAEGNSVILIGFPHGDGRHDDDFVGVDEACLMGFGTAYDDTIGTAFDDVEIQIRVILGMRSLAAVAFRVGHGAIDGKVVLLYPGEEFLEVFMVMSAVFLVDFIGCGEHGVGRIHADAALEAGRCLLAEETLHPDFVDEVLGALVDVGETVDLFTGQG